MFKFNIKKLNIKKLFAAILLIAVFTALDRISKAFAVNLLKGKDDIVIIKNALVLHYLENTGAAFSILTGKQLFFKIVTPVFIVVLIYFLIGFSVRKKDFPFFLLDILLISGAIGNYLDRLKNGFVIDFIYFSLINFPVFNVADIYVTTSVFLFAFILLFFYKEDN